MVKKVESVRPRHARAKRKPWVRVTLKTLLMSFTVVLLAASLTGVYAVTRLTSQASYFSLGDENQSLPQIGAVSGAVNMLLVGSDTRNGLKGDYGKNPGSTLNDVNILLHISEDHSKATIISIPRDTYVNVPSCKDPVTGAQLGAVTGMKINATLSRGGMACVRNTVQELTGLKIPYAALVTFDGVVAMSNAVGGVQVCVAKAINDDYTGLHLSAGTHTLQGRQALEFLRTRHGVGDGSDLTRISSQQVYLSSLVRKLKDDATLNNIPELYGLANAAVKNIGLSDSLNNADTLVTIARALAPIELSKVAFVQYPTTLYGDGVIPNEASANLLMKAVKNDAVIKFGSKQTSGDSSLPGSVTSTKKSTSTASPAPTTSPSPSASASDNTVTLNSDTYGQTAAQQTCSVGNKLGHRSTY